MLEKNQNIFILLALLLITVTAYSQSATARWLLLKPSAQAMALGGAGAGYDLNTFSAYFNPAALAFSKKITASVSFVKPYPFFPDVMNLFIGISRRINERSIIALSVNSYKNSIQMKMGSDGVEQMTLNSQTNWHLKFTYAHNINQSFSYGFGLGYLSYNLVEQSGKAGYRDWGSASAMTVDLGFYAHNLFKEFSLNLPGHKLEGWLGRLAEDQLPGGLSVGIAAQNLGTKVSFVNEEEADPLPGVILFGFSYWPLTSNKLGLQVLTDLEKQLVDASTINFARFGSELRVYRILALRGGYVLDTFGLKKSYPTWGLGFCTRDVSINIARYNPTFLATWHFDVQLHLEY